MKQVRSPLSLTIEVGEAKPNLTELWAANPSPTRRQLHPGKFGQIHPHPDKVSYELRSQFDQAEAGSPEWLLKKAALGLEAVFEIHPRMLKVRIVGSFLFVVRIAIKFAFFAHGGGVEIGVAFFQNALRIFSDLFADLGCVGDGPDDTGFSRAHLRWIRVLLYRRPEPSNPRLPDRSKGCSHCPASFRRRNVSLMYFPFRRTWTRQQPDVSRAIVAKRVRSVCVSRRKAGKKHRITA